jgi:serine/threonine protein kinase
MSQAAADRNLLFGILALQMDFIGRDELIAAMHAWVLDKAKPLGQILLDQGALAGADHPLLEAMVQRHLEKHGGDVERSLAAAAAPDAVRAELRQITDDKLHASLAQLPVKPTAGENLGSTTAPVAADGARFQILRPHARGGLGEVFVARDGELNREVALKEIQTRHAEHPESRARFMREAEITGGLEHPGIVPVYALGHHPDGRPYYAMRFIRGTSLKEAIDRFHNPQAQGLQPLGFESLAFRQMLNRFIAVCNAIAYAHSRGVLHRDLKPGNIMLGEFGETLVVDWGLAKAGVGGAGDEKGESLERTTEPMLSPTDSDLTRTGQALGTPAYMSPEQAAGRLDQMGAASDIYSLGATLYYVLTGQAPFAKSDVGDVLNKVQKGDFLPPRQRNRQVPAALEAICLKAMALRAQDRYISAKALADDLEHWLADEAVTAHAEPWHARLGRWVRHHKGLVGSATAVLVVGLTVVIASWLLNEAAGQQKKEQELRGIAESEREEASKQRALANRYLYFSRSNSRRVAVIRSATATQATRSWQTG